MIDTVAILRAASRGETVMCSEMKAYIADEIERLREALREIAEGDRPDNDEQFCVGYWGATARAALGEGE